jgi:hypothetical protein
MAYGIAMNTMLIHVLCMAAISSSVTAFSMIRQSSLPNKVVHKNTFAVVVPVVVPAVTVPVFIPTHSNRQCPSFSTTRLFAEDSNDNANSDVDVDNDEIQDNNIFAKTSWYAAEAFGKIFSNNSMLEAQKKIEMESNNNIDLSTKPSSLKQTIQRIKLDNDRFYFLSGNVDALTYDANCYFADPFVGFTGTQRFVDNLANLGSFITNYDVKVLQYQVSDDDLQVQTKLMVKLELNLPWKPILAWPWGVEYKIDPDSFLILSHLESWDISPLEGVKQVFRKPTLQI